MAEGPTAAPLNLIQVKPRYGPLKLLITIRSKYPDWDDFSPAEIVYLTPTGPVIVETIHDENWIILDPICGVDAEGPMPPSIKFAFDLLENPGRPEHLDLLKNLGLLKNPGLPLDWPFAPFGFKKQKISVYFLTNLSTAINQVGSIDHVALLVGNREKKPGFVAQMIFSTEEDWEAFTREPM